LELPSRNLKSGNLKSGSGKIATCPQKLEKLESEKQKRESRNLPTKAET